MISNEIDLLIYGNFTSRNGEYIYSTDPNGNLIENEIEKLLTEKFHVECSIGITEAFDSPGYSCSVLSIAWIENEKLHLSTYLISY